VARKPGFPTARETTRPGPGRSVIKVPGQPCAGRLARFAGSAGRSPSAFATAADLTTRTLGATPREAAGQGTATPTPYLTNARGTNLWRRLPGILPLPRPAHRVTLVTLYCRGPKHERPCTPPPAPRGRMVTAPANARANSHRSGSGPVQPGVIALALSPIPRLPSAHGTKQSSTT
jgi:hypothetical protein